MRSVCWALWTLLLLVIAGIFVATVVERIQGSREPSLPKITQVPTFNLTERGGREVVLEDLRGAPWVASFLSTRCGGNCLRIAERLVSLFHGIPLRSSVRLVTFTVEPEHDTAPVLRRFAHDLGVGSSGRWLWLTGDREALLELATEGFLLEGTAPLPQNHPFDLPAPEPVTHSNRLALVDGDGWIRGFYNALHPGELELLARDLEALTR